MNVLRPGGVCDGSRLKKGMRSRTPSLPHPALHEEVSVGDVRRGVHGLWAGRLAGGLANVTRVEARALCNVLRLPKREARPGRFIDRGSLKFGGTFEQLLEFFQKGSSSEA